MGDLNDENIDVLEAYAHRMLERWLGWLDSATPVPEPVMVMEVTLSEVAFGIVLRVKEETA